MRVLVTFASRHSATAGIAEAVAAVLMEEGGPDLTVEVAPVEDVDSVADYDAVVIGSAIYLGRWLTDARDLVRRTQDDLRARPVWLFSSGPLGEPAAPAEDAADEDDLAEEIGAVAHRTFPGALRRAELDRGERLAARLVSAPEGDFRDWDEVRHWAEEIVDALAS